MRRGGGGGGGGGQNRRGGSPRSQNFDSSGPDIKVRGTAQQVVDKYQSLAREAATAGDPVAAENYYQHAEHYYRIMHANGGGENRQNGRQPDGERFQDGDRMRDDNEANEFQQGPENGSDEEAAAAAAGPDEQAAEGRRNGQNGRRRSQPAPQDEADTSAPSPAAASPEETGEAAQ